MCRNYANEMTVEEREMLARKLPSLANNVIPYAIRPVPRPRVLNCRDSDAQRVHVLHNVFPRCSASFVIRWPRYKPAYRVNGKSSRRDDEELL